MFQCIIFRYIQLCSKVNQSIAKDATTEGLLIKVNSLLVFKIDDLQPFLSLYLGLGNISVLATRNKLLIYRFYLVITEN